MKPFEQVDSVGPGVGDTVGLGVEYTVGLGVGSSSTFEYREGTHGAFDKQNGLDHILSDFRLSWPMI